MGVNRPKLTEEDLKYLMLLSKSYPNIQSASIEIINLQAILNLPKGTELFLSDLHGEYESFTHMLKSASGVIRQKIDDTLGCTLEVRERNSLATLIYYPEQKLEIIKQNEKNEESLRDWYRITLYRLVQVCRCVCSKYTRSKVRKALPENFSYILGELLNENNLDDKEAYYNQIIATIIEIGQADAFIIALAKVIQKLALDRLHILGDIFDRGKGPDIILDALMEQSSVDIQWGNHDILWIGAAAGSDVCIANVIRIAARNQTLGTLEDGYGINLLPLATFAMDSYKDDPCTLFIPADMNEDQYSPREIDLQAKINKAITMIQFKLEAEAIHRRFMDEMEDRLVLEKIDYKAGTIRLGDKVYRLKDHLFPTIDPKNPAVLTSEEKELIEKLRMSFTRNEKLHKHVQFLFAKGSMYKVFNSNLLFHGCIPLEENGDFKKVKIGGCYYSGKAYIDELEKMITDAYLKRNDTEEKQKGLDFIWYLWTGKNSPLFGKDKMATFERLFLSEKETHVEHKNAYFQYRDNVDVVNKILNEFGLDPEKSHIINGHVPVITKNGESPIKANGKLIVIDGGLAKPYHKETGIAGYTLFYNSYGLLLASLLPFLSIENAIKKEADIVSFKTVLEKTATRKRVADTDTGASLKDNIGQLKKLLYAYQQGYIKES